MIPSVADLTRTKAGLSYFVHLSLASVGTLALSFLLVIPLDLALEEATFNRVLNSVLEPPFAPLNLVLAAFVGYLVNRCLGNTHALFTWVPSAVSLVWAFIVSLQTSGREKLEPFCDDCWGSGWGGFFLLSAIAYSVGAFIGLRRYSNSKRANREHREALSSTQYTG